MDKNTLYGLLLMALVLFGFMWLQPKPEVNTPSETAESEQAAPVTTSRDLLSPPERQWLAENIAEHGSYVASGDTTAKGYSMLDTDDMHLTLRGDSITGYVVVDGKNVDYTELTGATKDVPAALQRKAVELVRETSTSMGRYGRFAQFLKGEEKVVKLENDVLSLQLNTKSGSITRAELKKYDTEYSADESKKQKRKVVIFEGESDAMAFRLPLPQEISTSELYFTPTVLNDSTVLMSLPVTESAYWGIEYTLPKGDNYVVRMRIVQRNMAQLVQSNNRILGLDWHQDIKRQEQGRMFEERNSGLYYKFAGGSVENLSEAKDAREERQAKLKWIGFKNQFFSSVLIARKPFQTADFDSKILKNSDYLKSLTATAQVNDYDWNSENPATFDYFIGPNLYPMLRHLDKTIQSDEDLKLTKLIPLGWSIFRWINTGVIIPIFNFLGKFISNYGIIILLLTIFIKLVLFPLTYKSYQSQAKMRVLAPDIKAINEKYPGNDNNAVMKRNQKTMELYSKAGASPMSGCLPMLLQMPILFAMFSFFPNCIELRGQSFLWAHDLSAPDAIVSWGGYIPLITPYFGNHISLFCLLMTITNIVYSYINMQNQPNSMPGMKWMMYLMPVFFMIFFNNYAAGLSYYYFLSLLITIIQTYAFRYIIREDKVRAAMAEAAKKPKKKSGFMARLEEMQKQQQEMMRQQQKQQQRAKK